MDAVLVTPPSEGRVPLYFKKQSPGVCFLSSYLRENGFEALVVDSYLLGLKTSETVERILDLNPLLIGLSIPDVASLRPMMEIAGSLRSSGIDSHITVGGYIPTVASQELLSSFQGIDSIIRGEGEVPLLELMSALKNKRTWENVPGISFPKGDSSVAVPLGKPVQDLDQLPFMARDDLPYVLTSGAREADISSSRGCYGQCSFCCMPPFYDASGSREWRGRSPQNILNEIEFLINHYGVYNFHFTDENFIGDNQKARTRAVEFITLFEKRCLDIQFHVSCRADDVDFELFQRLKRIGLRGVFLGLESGVQSMLDRLNKRITVQKNIKALEILDHLEIEYFPSYIMMDAFTTTAEFSENLKFLQSNNIALHPGYILQKLIVMPKTKTQYMLADQGRLLGSFWEGYSYSMDESMERLYQILSIGLRPLIDLSNTIHEKQVDNSLPRATPLLMKAKEKVSSAAINFSSEAVQYILDNGSPGTDSPFIRKLSGKAGDFTEEMCKLMGLLIEVSLNRTG